ncbi:hypothetical protein [Streptomyces sp. NPDC059979]|uniref:hypothetical protein n=1 Tax=Streptomyces sp. NPDC059979 TaxID=3347021 RepID=UPI00367B0E16
MTETLAAARRAPAAVASRLTLNAAAAGTDTDSGLHNLANGPLALAEVHVTDSQTPEVAGVGALVRAAGPLREALTEREDARGFAAVDARSTRRRTRSSPPSTSSKPPTLARSRPPRRSRLPGR